MEITEIVVGTEQDGHIEMLAVADCIDVALPLQQSRCIGACAFAEPENHASESEERSKVAAKLSGLIFLYVIFMAVEIVGGLKANSLAILTDAAHLLVDAAGVAISLFSIWAAGWKPTARQSFGFNRLEVLGALLSVQLIWLISGFLICEAVTRMIHNESKVNGKLMFVIAAFGFVINLIMVAWLGHNHTHHGHACSNSNHGETCGSTVHHGHEFIDHDDDHDKLCDTVDEEEAKLVPDSLNGMKITSMNINLQGAYLHAMADMIQSVGVMVAGAIMWAKPDWVIVDLMCTLIFSVVVLSTTIGMLRNTFGILMERTPNEIDIGKLEDDLKSMKGVQDVHDLHVWAVTVKKIVMSCHVIAEPGISSYDILHRIRDYCRKTYRIQHVTIQVE